MKMFAWQVRVASQKMSTRFPVSFLLFISSYHPLYYAISPFLSVPCILFFCLCSLDCFLDVMEAGAEKRNHDALIGWSAVKGWLNTSTTAGRVDASLVKHFRVGSAPLFSSSDVYKPDQRPRLGIGVKITSSAPEDAVLMLTLKQKKRLAKSTDFVRGRNILRSYTQASRILQIWRTSKGSKPYCMLWVEPCYDISECCVSNQLMHVDVNHTIVLHVLGLFMMFDPYAYDVLMMTGSNQSTLRLWCTERFVVWTWRSFGCARHVQICKRSRYSTHGRCEMFIGS